MLTKIKVKVMATALMMLALTVQSVIAESINVVGYNRVDVAANTDVLVSVPFIQNSEGTFTVTAVTGTGVTVADTLGVDAYAATYYVRFTSGAAKGRWSTITSNTVNDLVLENNTFLPDITIGDVFEIIPHLTLDKVFPDALEGRSFEKSASLFNRSTEVLIPNTASVGINKAASATYYYYNDEWRKVGAAPTISFNDVVVSPEEYFVIRNRSDKKLTFVISGNVPAMTLVCDLPKETQKNDIAAVSGRPIAMKLSQLGLGGTAAFTTTTLLFNRQDELMVFDNDAAGINKAAAATYFYYDGAWRKVGASPTTSFDDELVSPGAALIIRKASGAAGTVTWTQNSPY